MRREVDFRSILKLAGSAHAGQRTSLEQRRKMIADLCRMIGIVLLGQDKTFPPVKFPLIPATPLPHISPRLKQCLHGLLQGDSEKQIARKLGISRHTVHIHVRKLYVVMNVSSRGELLARFIGRELPEDLIHTSLDRSHHAG